MNDSQRAVMAAVLLLAGAPIKAQDSFLESETYASGENIVGVLLTDEEYGLMTPGGRVFDRSIDWAWVRGKDGEDSVGFVASDYRTIVVESPVDYTAGPIDDLAATLHEALLVNARRLGWSPAEQGELVLSTAIVNVVDAEGTAVTAFFNATKRHTLELEFMLAERASGTPLLVARDEVNSGNLVGAMWRAVAHLTSMLSTPMAPRYPARGVSISLDAYELPSKKPGKPHELEKYADARAIALDALRSSGIFEDVAEASNDADYGLEIEVLNANLDGAYQTTVNVNANYVLTDRRTGSVYLWENVGTSASLSAADIRKGAERARQVTSDAFRNNIDLYVQRLDAKLGATD
jgi:hypothetical protein